MTNNASKLPKQQHYVPQFMLKGFAAGKHDQVWVFDKKTGKTFRTTVRNVAVQRAFYDVPVPGGTLSLEPSLASFEGEVAPLVKRIRRERSIGFLTEADRGLIALFIAAQRIRTQQWRVDFAQASAHLAAHMRHFAKQMGLDPNTTVGIPRENLSEEEIKLQAIRMLEEAHEHVPYLLDKTWILFGNDTSFPFYISDNPVTLQNSRDFGPYGNIGYAVPGIEIYLPLSKDLCLGLLCPSFEERAREIQAVASAVDKLKVASKSELAPKMSPAEVLLRGIDTGAVVPSVRDNIVRNNSLQVKYAEQYIFCPTDDFGLVRDMLQKHPHLRSGPRMHIGTPGMRQEDN